MNSNQGMDKNHDILVDSDRLRQAVLAIIKSNDLNINTIERRCKLKIGVLENWLNAQSRNISHQDILKVIERLGMTFSINIKAGVIQDPEALRRINNFQERELRDKAVNKTNQFIGE